MELAKEIYYTVEDYYATPDGVRNELINGEFYDMAQPTFNHQKILAWLSRQIGNYIEDKGGDCEVIPAPFGVQLFENEDTVVEPDISVICDPDKINDRGCEGAPDWIIEIVSPSNSGHDYVRKLNLYSRAQVREYWIVDPVTWMVTVYFPQKSKGDFVEYTFDDKIQSGIYEDLTIDFAEIKKGLRNINDTEVQELAKIHTGVHL